MLTMRQDLILLGKQKQNSAAVVKMSSSFYRLSNESPFTGDRKCKTPTEKMRMAPLHLNAIKRHNQSPPLGSNISTKGNSSYLMIAPEQDYIQSGRLLKHPRIDTCESDVLSMRSPSADFLSSRSNRLTSNRNVLSPLPRPTTSLYSSQGESRLSPVKFYHRPHFNSTYQVSEHLRPRLNHSYIQEGSSINSISKRIQYRSARKEYRDRGHSNSSLSRSGVQSSLNRSQIQDVESRLKDMNKKILEAMAESRRTVVQLLTEPMDASASLEFEAKLKEVQQEREKQKLNTPLIETKSKLLSIKSTESTGSKGNPLSSRQGTKRTPEDLKPSDGPIYLTESVNQIEPKMTHHLGSSAFILNSLNSGLSQGQNTSNFTGLLKDMQDAETDQVLLGSKQLSSKPEFLKSLHRIESNAILETEKDKITEESKVEEIPVDKSPEIEESILAVLRKQERPPNIEIIDSKAKRAEGIEDLLRRESGPYVPQAPAQNYFKSYLKKSKSTPKGSLTFGQKSSVNSVKRELKYTTNESQDECTFGNSGSNLFQSEQPHFVANNVNGSMNRSTPESAQLGGLGRLKQARESVQSQEGNAYRSANSVQRKIEREEIKAQENEELARESNYTAGRDIGGVITDDHHGSAATLTNGYREAKDQMPFPMRDLRASGMQTSGAEIPEERSYFTNESRRYEDSGYNSETNQAPSLIEENPLEQKESTEKLQMLPEKWEEDWVIQSSPPCVEGTAKYPRRKMPSLKEVLIIPPTRKSGILDKQIGSSQDGNEDSKLKQSLAESSLVFDPPSTGNLGRRPVYNAGESSFADDERSNIQSFQDSQSGAEAYYERGRHVRQQSEHFSGEITINGESPTLSRISEEESPLCYTNKFSRNESGILANSEPHSADPFQLELQVAEMKKQQINEIKEQDTKTEQSDLQTKEVPHYEEVVRVLGGTSKNLISNDSMFRSATPTSTKNQVRRGPPQVHHSKTNSWLNQTISAVQAEADAAVHEPPEERGSINQVYKKGPLSEEQPLSHYKRDSAQTASTRKVSLSAACHKGKIESIRPQDTSSFVYLKVDSSVVSEMRQDGSFVEDPQNRLPYCFERNYERLQSNCKDSFLIHGGSDCQKIDCLDASILASTTPTAYNRGFVLYNQDSAKNNRYSKKSQVHEIEYEEFEDSNSCLESDALSGRRSCRPRTPLCIFIPSGSDLISSERIGEVLEQPQQCLAFFKSKRNDIPAYITDKAIFYGGAISARFPNAQSNEEKSSNSKQITSVNESRSSQILEYSHSPEQASVIQDSVFMEIPRSYSKNVASMNVSNHHLSFSSGNNTTIRGFVNNLALMEERATIHGRHLTHDDEDDKQLAQAFGLNLTEPRALINSTTYSNAPTPSKPIRPPISLESGSNSKGLERPVMSDFSKTPKAFSLPLSTPENKPLTSQTPSGKFFIASPKQEKSKKPNHKRGPSGASPSINMMKLKLAEINEESEDNRISSSTRREERISVGGALLINQMGENLRRLSKEEVTAEIRNWLSQMNLESLTSNFVDAGFDDLNALLLQAKSRVPITRQLLHKIGVDKPGHQCRILVKLELDNIQQATSVTATPRDPRENNHGFRINLHEKNNRTGFLCCGPNTSCSSAGADSHATEQSSVDKKRENQDVKINVVEPEDTKDKRVPSLVIWLEKLRLKSQLENFISSGYDDLEWMFLQMQSSIPLSDQILEHEVSINKIGYRSRILYRLAEDAARYEQNLERANRRQTLEGTGRLINLETSSEKAAEGACRCSIF